MKRLLILLIPVLFFSCDPNEIFDMCSDSEWYVDADGDGFGSDVLMNVGGCDPPEGFADNNEDCDDTNASVQLEATFYEDNDGDGFGNLDESTFGCDAPQGFVANSLDCDDTDPNSATADTFYEDADGDGLGNPDVSVEACEQPDGFVTNSNDDDDGTTGGNGGGGDSSDNGFFYPLTIGNSWTYDVNGQEDESVVTDSFVDDGITKFTITSSSQPDNPGTGWYDGMIGTVMGNIGVANESIDFLDDNKSVGEGWTEMFNTESNGVTFSNTYDYVFEELFDEYMVGNQVFQDVKVISLTASFESDGLSPTVFSIGEYYWARGVGLVEAELTDEFSGTSFTTRIIDFQIN